MGDGKPDGWRCPTCGRRFVRRPHEHSCEVRSLEAHLERGSPAVRETFEALREVLGKIGPHGVVPVKTMILLRGASNFAGVTIKRDALDLEFASSRSLSHARIRKSQQFGPARFSHHIRLTGPGDIDASVARWLRAAYELGSGPRKPAAAARQKAR
jgi:hypothetical protein